MESPTCEACHAAAAVMTLTEVNATAVTERRLCAACAVAAGVGLPIDLASVPMARPARSPTPESRARLIDALRVRRPEWADALARRWRERAARDGDATGSGETGSGETGSGETGSGETDAGETDAGETDAGETDAGETDAGETDAGETDAGETDRSEPPTG